MPDQLFPLGRVIMTTNLQGRVQEDNPEHWEEELQGLIKRHHTGDWGDLDVHDQGVNAEALERGGRLFSAYNTPSGIRIYIITESDRTVTTALLPEDY